MAARKFLVPISLPVDPVNPLEAATKQYVDNKPAASLPTTGQAAQTHLRANSATAGDYGWTLTGEVPIFATAAARDSAWASPPDGAVCVVGTMLQLRASGVWYGVASPSAGGLYLEDPNGHIVFWNYTSSAAAGEVNGAGQTYLKSSGVTVFWRQSSDGAVGGKTTDAAILIQPNPASAHGSWSGSEWALLGCYPATNDTAVWNNLRVQTGLFVGWTTPKSAPMNLTAAKEFIGPDPFEAGHFDGDGVDLSAALVRVIERLMEARDRIDQLEARIAALEAR